MQLGLDEYISSTFYLCATFVLWLDVINMISFFYLSLPVRNLHRSRGGHSNECPNCIFAGTLCVISIKICRIIKKKYFYILLLSVFIKKLFKNPLNQKKQNEINYLYSMCCCYSLCLP